MKQLTHLLLIGSLCFGALSCTSEDIFDISHRETNIKGMSLQNADEKDVPEHTLQDLIKLSGYLNIPVTRNGNEVYPEWYGGEYVDENGHIVVLAKTIPSQERTAIEKNISDLVFKQCANSYSSLQDVMFQIRNKAENKDDFIYDNVAFYGIDIKSNSVQVGLFHNTEDNILAFKRRVVDSPLLTFVECVEIKDNANNDLICGGTISNKFANASIGYRAKDKNGKIGIVTAGHFVVDGQAIYSPLNLNTPIGSCTESLYNEGTVDAAFCQILASNFIPSNKIDFMANPEKDTLSTDVATYFGVGTYLNMIGSVSKKIVSGTIDNSSYDLPSDVSGTKILLTNTLLMNYEGKEGDSGGVLYQLTKSTNKRATAAIHSKTITIKYSDGSVKKQSIACKASDINKIFNLKRY